MSLTVKLGRMTGDQQTIIDTFYQPTTLIMFSIINLLSLFGRTYGNSYLKVKFECARKGSILHFAQTGRVVLETSMDFIIIIIYF